MVYLSLAFNFMIEQTYFPPSKEELLANIGYRELLKLLSIHPNLKANLFFEGRTSFWLKEKSPDIVDMVKNGVKDKRYEIGNYTYTHPILSLIPYEDVYKQIAEALNVDEKIWGLRPKGLILPEGGYDPSLTKIFSDLGIEWALISAKTYERDFPKAREEDLHTAFMLRGIFDTLITGICIADFGPRTHVTTYWVEVNPKDFIKRITIDQKNLIYVLKQDAEFIYYSSVVMNKKEIGESADFSKVLQKLEFLFGEFDRNENIHPMLISEYLEENPPKRTICLRPCLRGLGARGRKSFDQWLKGSEKVGYMIDEARNEIKTAEYVLTLAQKIGLDTSRSEKIIKKAWDKLLKAETSTGRRAVAHPQGQPSRIIYSMEHAVEAKNLARKAVEGITALKP